MSQTKQTVAHRRDELHARLEAACKLAGRSTAGIHLLAVSKTQPAGKIRELALLGQRSFGENYVDEAQVKMAELTDLNLEWHFIGPLQSNKTRAVAEQFDWVQSVDRPKLIRRLGEQRPFGLGPLNVLIQVNLDEERQKAGCAPADIDHLADTIAEQPGLRLRGLMAIPALRERLADQRAVFRRLRELYEPLAQCYPTVDTLSAGMSADIEAAILEGCTMVRIGTALFGPR